MPAGNLQRRLLSVVMLPLVAVQGNAQSTAQTKRSQARKPPPLVRLTLDQVLGWRSKYGYLIGMKEDQAIAVIGAPTKREIKPDGALLTFDGPKTDGRSIDLRIRERGITAVYVYPKRDESFDVNLIFAKADQFTFESGLLSDSTEAFLLAKREGTEIRIVTLTLGETEAQAVLDCVILF